MNNNTIIDDILSMIFTEINYIFPFDKFLPCFFLLK